MELPGLKIHAPKQLLVEGRTPQLFFEAWVKELGLKIEVQNFKSVGELTGFLRSFALRKEFKEIVESVAIIRDAEDGLASSAFTSVCGSLRSAGLICPEKSGEFGTGEKRAGVFILPDCVNPGMLETLCWTAIEGDPKLAQEVACIEAHLQCLGGASVKTKNSFKAKVWMYLAGRGEFDPQVGRAAQAKVWDWSSPALLSLRSFLQSL